MQGGQGDIKHWAFNDPPRRKGKHKDRPPSPEEFLRLGTRVVDLHPVTVMQNARTSGGGRLDLVPTQAVTVGPRQTWMAEKVSIWQAGNHDVEHFLIAGREMDVYLGIASLAATEFGIVTCAYTAQNGYDKGFAGATPGVLMAAAMLLVGLTSSA
jgi:hypothetical protein